MIHIINYDVLDKIISYLDITSTINLLISSKDIYYMYVDCVQDSDDKSNYYKLVMSRKIVKYFKSLNNIPQEVNIKLRKDYKSLHKIYNHFSKHNDAPLSDMLVYLCDIHRSNKFLFKFLISYCKFSNTSKDLKYWNMLTSDDVIYLLIFADDISIIIKSIHIEAQILMHVINYKLRFGKLQSKHIDILLLFDYLLYKHFFRTSQYIENIITDIICEVINTEDIYILNKIYEKQNFYKFKVDYQVILRSCLRRMSLEILEIINLQLNLQMAENTHINQHIIIKKEDIMYLMKKKSFKMLMRIVELYLGNMINMTGYMNCITPFIDYNNKECIQLVDYIKELKSNKLN
jgi:hypothetical protein